MPRAVLPSLSGSVSALTYSLVREECDEERAGPRSPRNEIANYVLEQLRQLPDYLRLPMKALTLVFDAEGILVSGRPFHERSHDARWRQIERWRTSRLGFRVLFVRFYQGLVVYCWHACLDERRRGS
jgi:hypothetical protein